MITVTVVQCEKLLSLTVVKPVTCNWHCQLNRLHLAVLCRNHKNSVHISNVSLCSKRRISEVPLRAGLKHTM